ncbi:MAG: hypothetical protein LBG90_07275 [Spirochaetaceae bacterium]|jgi:hypothetical protein|nr:hypothetical protein [Spirochaetaceae bacterium]
MYLDPGFGSMLIQAIIGGIAVAGSGLFLFRQKVAAFFNHIFKKDKPHD